MLKFRPGYFICFLILLIIEICIAKFYFTEFIRNNVGDFLVVILLYCLAKAFINLPVISTSILVLIFSYAIEALQYLNIVEKLHLQHFKLARIIIGTSFSWADIVAYTLGIGFVLLIEKVIKPKIIV